MEVGDACTICVEGVVDGDVACGGWGLWVGLYGGFWLWRGCGFCLWCLGWLWCGFLSGVDCWFVCWGARIVNRVCWYAHAQGGEDTEDTDDWADTLHEWLSFLSSVVCLLPYGFGDDCEYEYPYADAEGYEDAGLV